MPTIDWSQISIAGTALLVIGYLGGKLIDWFFTKRQPEQEELKDVVKANTLAINGLVSFLQITLTKNETSMEQVVKNTDMIPGINSRLNDVWEAVKS